MKKYFSYSILIHVVILSATYFSVVGNYPIEKQWVTIGFGEINSSIESKNEIKKKLNKENTNLPKAINSGDSESKATNSEVNEELKSLETKLKNYNGGNIQIDFKGKRERGLYNFSLPEYPNGVVKEIDIVFRIQIEPDGIVTKVFPLIKADTRLEDAAINSIKKWRFEPLPSSIPQVAQQAIVIFPYRLR